MKELIGRMLRVLAWLLAATSLGVIGFRAIEGASWVDALYMTVITLSTVGYSEAFPLSPAGKIFTTFFIIVGVGLVLYLLAAIAEFIVGGGLRDTYRRERKERMLENRTGHVIVAGFGRFGRAVMEELRCSGQTVTLIDMDPDLEDELRSLELDYVIASASSDEGLIAAGIAGASAIVVATPSEAESVFITLAARELNPEIRIHARGESDAATRRLRRAGANQVIAPFQMGGLRAATAILRPAVVDFLEIVAPHTGAEIDLEEIRVDDGSPLCGSTVEAAEQVEGAFRIVALKRVEEPIRLIPRRDVVIGRNDLLVVIGEREALMALARRAEAN